MTDDPTASTRALARQCAHGGLNLRDSVRLFDAIYTADALHLARGDHAEAARIAGVERGTLLRARRREERAMEGQ